MTTLSLRVILGEDRGVGEYKEGGHTGEEGDREK
jgi:hypothetical protein